MPAVALAALAIAAAPLAGSGCGNPSGEGSMWEPHAGAPGPASALGDPGPLCRPDGGGPYWIVEGEPLEFTVECTGELQLSGEDIAVSALPSGAEWDPDTRTVSWTPGLDQAQVVTVAVDVPSTGEVASVKIGVADAFAHPDNVPVVDPLRYGEEYGLPVLFLFDAPLEKVYQPSTVIYGGETYTMEAKLRGASSLSYPKNSYTLKFDNAQRFSDPDRDFLHKRKMTLTQAFDDNSYLRTRLGFELWNLLDPDHVQVQTYSAVVYLEGEYWGLYTITDHIDRHLMEQAGLNVDGNLYKAVTHDANFRLTKNSGGDKNTLHDGVEKKEGTPDETMPGAFDDYDDLVMFVATADDDAFWAEIDDRIRREDYQNWWKFVMLLVAGDTAGKNSYHYRDPTGGPWRAVPWDLNHAFGQDWKTFRLSAQSSATFLNRNELFTRLFELPASADAIEAELDAQLAGGLSLDVVVPLLDTMAAEIHPSALRDEQRWQAAYRAFGRWDERTDFTTHEQEIDYVRQWLVDRWTALDSRY